MIQSLYIMQLVLGVKNAEIIAYEIKGSNLYKKGKDQGTWLAQVVGRLLISAQIMIPGLWD